MRGAQEEAAGEEERERKATAPIINAGSRTSPHTADSQRRGRGFVSSTLVSGERSVIDTIHAHYPLKLMHAINRYPALPSPTPPPSPSPLLRLLSSRLPSHLPPVVQMLSYGGGLVSSDCVRLTARLHPHSSLLLTTPAHGRVYGERVRGAGRVEMVQEVECGEGSLALVVPSPLGPLRASEYAATLSVALGEGASLLLFDGLTSGRATLAEHFSVARYSSSTTVARWPAAADAAPLLRDRTVIVPPHAALHRHRAQATVVLLGPALLPLAVALYRGVQQRTVGRREGAALWDADGRMRGCITSASWVAGSPPSDTEDEAAAARKVEGGSITGGCLLRLMGGDVAVVLDEVQRLLPTLDVHLQGVAPWQRRY